MKFHVDCTQGRYYFTDCNIDLHENGNMKVTDSLTKPGFVRVKAVFSARSCWVVIYEP